MSLLVVEAEDWSGKRGERRGLHCHKLMSSLILEAFVFFRTSMNGFQQKMKTLAVFVDLTKAFDKV